MLLHGYRQFFGSQIAIGMGLDFAEASKAARKSNFSGDIELFEGVYNYPRFKIYQFPDRETALAWDRSEEFRYAVSQRPPGFEVNRIMVPGHQL